MTLARAILSAPDLILADEPTGNLDPHTADHVFKALMQLVKATQVAMLIATHNMELAGRMDRGVVAARLPGCDGWPAGSVGSYVHAARGCPPP